MQEIEFKAWPKTPRLFRDMVITEKLDGTNSAVIVTEDGKVAAQSRNRLVTPGKQTDNYGFAGWVERNADGLREALGVGHHYGEWWGGGIARKYGLAGDDKRFWLFNVNRYSDMPTDKVEGLGVVPVLHEGPFDTAAVSAAVTMLKAGGSVAVPGFMKPEGVIVFHSASGAVFKVTTEKDETWKGNA